MRLWNIKLPALPLGGKHLYHVKAVEEKHKHHSVTYKSKADAVLQKRLYERSPEKIRAKIVRHDFIASPVGFLMQDSEVR